MTYIEFLANYAIWSMADLALTIRGLGVGHPELNPIADTAISAHGVVGLIAYKAILVLVMSLVTYRYWHRKSMRLVAYGGLTLLVFTVFNNVMVLS